MSDSIIAAGKDKLYLPLIVVVSVVVPLLVAILMYMPRSIDASGAPSFTAFQPLFHALLNGATAVLLLLAYYFIRLKKNIAAHKASTLTAFALSLIFLLSYVFYHYAVPSAKFGGQGIIRPIYFFILITHIILAAAIVPLALLTLYRAFTGQYSRHRHLARYTFPLWLYVAITGVVVYIIMKPYYA